MLFTDALIGYCDIDYRFNKRSCWIIKQMCRRRINQVWHWVPITQEVPLPEPTFQHCDRVQEYVVVHCMYVVVPFCGYYFLSPGRYTPPAKCYMVKTFIFHLLFYWSERCLRGGKNIIYLFTQEVLFLVHDHPCHDDQLIVCRRNRLNK